MQFKKLKDGGGCLDSLFALVGVWFLHFRDLLLYSFCSHVRDSQTTESQQQLVRWGREKDQQ